MCVLASHSRIIDYYVDNCLECGYTYDPERGVVQLPWAVKVQIITIILHYIDNYYRKSLEPLMKDISKIHMSSIMLRGLTGKRYVE